MAEIKKQLMNLTAAVNPVILGMKKMGRGFIVAANKDEVYSTSRGAELYDRIKTP